MIGVFDSGSGGLSVVSVVRKKAPNADILYFGDIANAPYGEKSAEELLRLTNEGVALLVKRGAASLLSACNSVSTAVLAGASNGLPFVEMSLPTAAYLHTFAGKCFLLIATPATIESGLDTKAVHGSVVLESLPIPGLAAASEFDVPEVDIEGLIKRALSSRRDEQYDGLILGCTHYPLVSRTIETLAHSYFGPIPLIDPAYPVADAVSESLDISGTGVLRFLVSKQTESFAKKVHALLPDTTPSIEVV